MLGNVTSGRPTPPTEESKAVFSSRRSSKLKPSNTTRAAKRGSSSSASSHEHGVVDGRHKRVWKACERCRMKKTKCDGESPCRRCKDDGLVCTAGTRKKTEFKQLPRGYAEVLENTQYALIATVQKLYTMVRNGESWELGEPELNDRGLPVIHNIAEKLGCIRPSPDMPQSFPEDAEEFAELQAQLFAGKMAGDEGGKSSEDSTSHPGRTERASSSDSDHSVLSRGDTQGVWPQPEQQPDDLAQYDPEQMLFDDPLFQDDNVKQEYGTSICDGSIATSSPVCSEFHAQSQLPSPSFRTESPVSPWSAGEEQLGQSHILDLTALYMRQHQQQYKRTASSLVPRNASGIANGLNMRNSYVPSNDGTIRPMMLDYNHGLDLTDQMDNVIFGDYETMAIV